MRNFFISDTHFGHNNIIKYCNRPFKTLDEMNETLVRNWNERVKPEDTVFVVGDFCFKNSPAQIHRGEGHIHHASYYENQLNGKKIFIKGSHDNNNSCKTCVLRVLIRLGGKNINIAHDPKDAIAECDFNIVGHVHNNWKFKKVLRIGKTIYMINVGVDMWDFRPITIEEILREFNKLNIEQNKKLAEKVVVKNDKQVSILQKRITNNP